MAKKRSELQEWGRQGEHSWLKQCPTYRDQLELVWLGALVPQEMIVIAKRVVYLQTLAQKCKQ
jgi:hypothetical protein